MLAAFIYLLVLLKAIRTAQWWRLRNHTDFNVLINTTIGLAFIWYLKVDFPDTNTPYLAGLNLHLVGATLMTLMFGWSFAIITTSLVVLTSTLFATGPATENLMTFPIDFLATCALPVTLSYAIFSVVDKRLPNNFFIYIFLCAFFTAAFSMASVIFSTTMLHYLSATYTMEILSYSYLPFGLILMFPEAFMTGMLMTIFVVYRPEWVSTFDDRRYLYKK